MAGGLRLRFSRGDVLRRRAGSRSCRRSSTATTTSRPRAALICSRRRRRFGRGCAGADCSLRARPWARPISSARSPCVRGHASWRGAPATGTVTAPGWRCRSSTTLPMVLASSCASHRRARGLCASPKTASRRRSASYSGSRRRGDARRQLDAAEGLPGRRPRLGVLRPLPQSDRTLVLDVGRRRPGKGEVALPPAAEGVSSRPARQFSWCSRERRRPHLRPWRRPPRPQAGECPAARREVVPRRFRHFAVRRSDDRSRRTKWGAVAPVRGTRRPGNSGQIAHIFEWLSAA